MAEKKFGNRTFRYDRLPAMQGLAEAAKAGKIMAQAEGLVLALLQGKVEDGLSAFFRLVREADAEEVLAFVGQTLARVRVNGDPIDDPDAYFDDKRELALVFWWALQTEFADFFGGSLTDVIERLATKLPAAKRARGA